MPKTRKKKKQPMISREDLARLTVESLDNKGIEVNENIAKVITKEFLKGIQYYLQKGYRVQIDQIGELCPTYRKVRTTKETVVESSKIRVELTTDMKKVLDSKLEKDERYRTYIEKSKKY